MTTNSGTLVLDHLGNVPVSYRHHWRIAEPHEPIVLPNRIFKWYHVHLDGAAVPEAMDAEARALLTADATSGAWQTEYGLDFALLHLSTAGAFLIAGTWRGHQEMWERVYLKDLANGEPFALVTRDGQDWPGACVWEMGVISHERMAWHRYLFTERDEAAKRAWLQDTYTGRV
jgi:hypothetical protein